MSDAVIPRDEQNVRSPTLRLAARGPLFDCHAALQARLELAFPAKQFQHVSIPARPTKAIWDRVRVATPFVGLCFLGLQPDANTGRIFRCDADWLVYLACRASKLEDLLTGVGAGVGQLGLASLGTALLHGWSVPDLGNWVVKAADNAAIEELSADNIGVVALQVACRLDLIDKAAAEALPEFLRVGAEWSLPPIGGLALDTVRDAA